MTVAAVLGIIPIDSFMLTLELLRRVFVATGTGKGA
jgi:hypothetical protein